MKSLLRMHVHLQDNFVLPSRVWDKFYLQLVWDTVMSYFTRIEHSDMRIDICIRISNVPRITCYQTNNDDIGFLNRRILIRPTIALRETRTNWMIVKWTRINLLHCATRLDNNFFIYLLNENLVAPGSLEITRHVQQFYLIWFHNFSTYNFKRSTQGLRYVYNP